MELTTKKSLFTFGVGAFGKMANLIKNTDYLPQKPAYLFKLLRMANSVEAKSKDIAKELTKNKDLVAKVLNVPSLTENFEKLDQQDYVNAIASLERNLIRNSLEIDFAQKYFKVLSARNSFSGLGERLTASVKAAIIAKAVSKWVKYPDAELAFFGALLSDVPAVVLGINDPEASEKIFEKVEQGLSEKEAEIIVHGFDQHEFGAKLFRYFAIPTALVEMMHAGFNPEEVKAKYKKLTQIVNFSKFIAKCFSDRTQSPSSIWQESQSAIHDLGLEISSEEWGNKISLLFVKSLEFEMNVSA